MKECLQVFIVAFFVWSFSSSYYLYKNRDYCEKIKNLQERIIVLENKTIVYGKWPEHSDYLEKDVKFFRKMIEEHKKNQDILNKALKIEKLEDRVSFMEGIELKGEDPDEK